MRIESPRGTWPVKLGLSIQSRNISLEALVDAALKADKGGFESFWVTESWRTEAFQVLARIAATSSRVKLGTGIVNIFSRSPALLGMSIATLDELSGGRAILGLGTSGKLVIEDWHGGRFAQPLRRMREYVEIIRLILSGKTVNYDGEIFHLKRFKLGFEKVRADIPIYIAALGSEMIQLSGELADGPLLYLQPKESIPAAVETAKAAAKKAGKDPSTVDVASYIPTCVSEDVELAKRTVAKTIAFYAGGMGVYYHRLLSNCGYEKEADTIREAWHRRDHEAAYGLVTDRMIRSLAVAGSVEMCREQVLEFRKAGVMHPIFHIALLGPEGETSLTETVERLATIGQA